MCTNSKGCDFTAEVQTHSVIASLICWSHFVILGPTHASHADIINTPFNTFRTYLRLKRKTESLNWFNLACNIA